MGGKRSWDVSEINAGGIIADEKDYRHERKFRICHLERSGGSLLLFVNPDDKKLRRSFASLKMTAS
jgi:hypothetical protein